MTSKNSSNGIRPAAGRLGILTPGLGAVATTFMAGVESIRSGHSKPIGSLTQMATIRLGKRTDNRSPLIKDFIPLASLGDIVFGAWDPIPDDALTAARKAGVLDERDLAPIADFLKDIAPMPAVFDNHYVTRINGANVKKGKNKRELAEALRQDIRNFKAKHALDRLVIVWCASTEIYLKPGPQHATIAAFERAMEENDDQIAPSMLYAWAALMEGVPFCNGAPNLSVDIPALIELANEKGVPISGKDFKTGQTWLKTVIAPGIKARMLGLKGWYSTNILGNRDGEVLDDPASFKTKEESKLSVLHTILQPDKYPGPVQGFLARRADQLLPAARRQQGGLGQHRHRRVDELPDADQGELPLPRFDPRGADRARPGALLRLRASRRDEGDSGMVKLLLQIPHGRCGTAAGARSFHPADETQEHA